MINKRFQAEKQQRKRNILDLKHGTCLRSKMFRFAKRKCLDLKHGTCFRSKHFLFGLDIIFLDIKRKPFLFDENEHLRSKTCSMF